MPTGKYLIRGGEFVNIDITNLEKNQRPMGMNPEEAFRLIGISRSTGYRMIENGTIKAVRLGRRLVVPMATIEQLLDVSK